MIVRTLLHGMIAAGLIAGAGAAWADSGEPRFETVSASNGNGNGNGYRASADRGRDGGGWRDDDDDDRREYRDDDRGGSRTTAYGDRDRDDERRGSGAGQGYRAGSDLDREGGYDDD